MDETRYDLTAHQPTAHHPARQDPTLHDTIPYPTHDHQTGASRRGLVALTVVIGLLALVGGAVVGASLGGSGTDTEPAEVAAATETTTTTEDSGQDEPTTTEPDPTPTTNPDPTPTTEPDPVEDPTPTTEPEDSDDGEGGGQIVTKIPPGLFAPQLTFDEVIDMGSASSAEWTLTNNGLGDVSWSLDTASGFSYSSPDASEGWLYSISGVLSPGESITITIGLATPLPGQWSETMTLKHGSFEDEVTITGHQPLQVVPAP